jgi:hypothetical protein
MKPYEKQMYVEGEKGVFRSKAALHIKAELGYNTGILVRLNTKMMIIRHVNIVV